jgi:hypothetical protein
MSCPIEILEVRGIHPDSSGVLTSVAVSGRITDGVDGCEMVHVRLTSPATNHVEAPVDAAGNFTAFIGGLQLECGDKVKVSARCKDCDPVDGEFPILCGEGPRPQYVSYYDCTGWNSNVEVMNLQTYDASFIITLYRRDGTMVWRNTYNTKPHETKRIPLDRYAPRSEGLAIVEPENDGDEFPSMLCITNAKVPAGLERIKITELQRFVPFIRVP